MLLTNIISIDTKLKIVRCYERIQGLFKNFSKYSGSKRRKIYIIGVPEYGNLGDHAIAISQRALLEEFFPEGEIIEVTNDMMNSHCLAIKYTLKKDDIVTLIGGGNFGDEYPSEENTRFLALKYFRRNKIVMFPQTVYFTDKGKDERNRMRKVIQKCRNLHLIYREKKSYDYAQKYFQLANNYLLIDTVLFLKYKNVNGRNGVLICCRNDKEAVIQKALINKIQKHFHSKGKMTTKIDTVLEKNISSCERKKIVYQYLDLFSKSEMVVTDRLHGMIFSAITNTPCVVFPNYNHKVSGCYDTIKELEYIRIVHEPFYSNFISLTESFNGSFIKDGYSINKYDEYKYLLKNILVD